MSKIAPVRPLFSLVSAVYGVEAYLPEFLASIRSQVGGLDDVELILVVDGSPDDSEGVIRRWIAETRVRASVIVQENAGPGAARNAGIAIATGEWLSFPDPDDVLHPRYLESVRSFLASAPPELDFLMARALRFLGSTAAARDDHALGFRFRRGTRIGSPTHDPKLIHLQIASAFVRREPLVEHVPDGFDVRVRPTFEDAHVIAAFWLRAGVSAVGILADAIYYYRQREDGTSLVQGSARQLARYTDLPKYGYLSLLEEAARSGPVPRWLQYLVLYDLQWPFREDHGMASATAGLPVEVRETYLEHVEHILDFIDDQVLLEFNATWVPLPIRLAWIMMKTGRVPDDLGAHISRTDAREQLIQIRYFTGSSSLRERVELDGVESPPVYAKTRSIEYFGRVFLYERILWISALNDVRIFTNGRSEPDRIRFGVLDAPFSEATVGRIWRGRQPAPAEQRAALAAIAPEAPAVVPWNRPLRRGYLALRWRVDVAADRLRQRRSRRSVAKTLAVARSSAARRRYAQAWVLMDRDDLAGDNAESLYRYLRAEQPMVNAWFVIRKDAPDYRRLRREGFRVIPFGSRQHIVLMKHAAHVISSHANGYVTHPYDAARFGRGSWKFTFLQHGVTTNDLSRWLNPKEIDLVLACTEPEYRSIVADGTQYVLSKREVALTGFPRHDDLIAAARRVPFDERDVILIMPTWRNYLLKRETSVGSARELVDDFWDSTYVTQWMALLRDPRLRDLAERTGNRIVFAPHPNLQTHLRPSHLPQHVEYFSYADADIKSMIGRAGIAITDYSSLATEAALTGVPVVYFQFDQEEFQRGTHAYRPGYFTPERDGFGPVAGDLDAAVESVARVLTDPAFAAPYLARIDAAFRYRDERNSERAFRAIQALDVPWHERDQSLFDGTTTEYDPAEASGAVERPTADFGAASESRDGARDRHRDRDDASTFDDDRQPDLVGT
ncbi:CDP-glycerol glycerophosphotransferase (TagB/SpsB family) [Agromyces ramosus]|uniref:CDP-glycerol glycerophosphotransferase (TagB/SpsB family) n=1 Tax=Agromyces ramosus TaxID=33879 RepID=A0A4Q7MP53_9MICO|nr:CDP-glycerol glycerophosphotransferase family protein [Agromyces ramosus]RZS68479.1 CDP-glycerol glycerophosphotransferase (TagB/SpsB family) [Agromyces ramosus]